MPCHHVSLQISLAKVRIQFRIGHSFFLKKSSNLCIELELINLGFWAALGAYQTDIGPTPHRVGMLCKLKSGRAFWRNFGECCFNFQPSELHAISATV